ncbi:rhodanese-like domain-containing protein [Acetobacterium malicum]|uniref:rhodanese-like domain-containing protein n=1 Tax=Acetobacterium malicum TaxID=52692 RepID=UPI0028802A17|nr:rhodanese-like domain-containing protein [Acetobacterium malicum]
MFNDQGSGSLYRDDPGQRPEQRAKTDHSRGLKKKLNNGETYQIIDTRITEQYAAGHLPEAQNIPHQDLRNKLALLDQTQPVITYCNKGVTGNATQNILLNHNFKNVFNLSGGFQFYDATKED